MNKLNRLKLTEFLKSTTKLPHKYCLVVNKRKAFTYWLISG